MLDGLVKLFPRDDMPYKRTATNVASEDKPRTALAVDQKSQADRDAVFAPPESAVSALHQVEYASCPGKFRRQAPSNADRQRAVESKSRPSVVAVLVFASSGHGLDSLDAFSSTRLLATGRVSGQARFDSFTTAYGGQSPNGYSARFERALSAGWARSA